MALNAGDRATIRSLNVLAIRFAILAARREVEEASADSREDGGDQTEVDKMAQWARLAAAGKPNPIEELAETIRCVAGGYADPYLVMGVLIEGAVHTVKNCIPPECQNDTASAILKLLADRLENAGLFPER